MRYGPFAQSGQDPPSGEVSLAISSMWGLIPLCSTVMSDHFALVGSASPVLGDRHPTSNGIGGFAPALVDVGVSTLLRELPFGGPSV